MISPLRHTPKGTYLHVRATPKAGRDEIVGLTVDAAGACALGVKVTAVPDKGKANLAVIATLAKAMRIAKSSFELSAGETSRNKVFRIIANEGAIALWLMDIDKNRA